MRNARRLRGFLPAGEKPPHTEMGGEAATVGDARRQDLEEQGEVFCRRQAERPRISRRAVTVGWRAQPAAGPAGDGRRTGARPRQCAPAGDGRAGSPLRRRGQAPAGHGAALAGNRDAVGEGHAALVIPIFCVPPSLAGVCAPQAGGKAGKDSGKAKTKAVSARREPVCRSVVVRAFWESWRFLSFSSLVYHRSR